MFRQLKKLLALIHVLENPICSCSNAPSLKDILKKSFDDRHNLCERQCCENATYILLTANAFFCSLLPHTYNKIAEIRRR